MKKECFNLMFNKLEIIQFGSSKAKQLNEAATPVALENGKLQQPTLIQAIVDDMLHTHYNTAHCAALAATQLDIKAHHDIKEIPAITVIDFTAEKNQPMVLINPKILERHGEGELPKEYYNEGCMSVAGGKFHITVPRSARCQKIKVEAYVIEKKSGDERKFSELTEGNIVDVTAGQWREFEVEGFMSKCVNHEIEHLEGMLFIEHGGPVKRKQNLAKLKKHKKGG